MSDIFRYISNELRFFQKQNPKIQRENAELLEKIVKYKENGNIVKLEDLLKKLEFNYSWELKYIHGLQVMIENYKINTEVIDN